MEYRELGKTGMRVSAISFGAWAIGGGWGDVSDDESYAALNRAVDLGVNFFDTADAYGNGRSERLLARLRKERSETIYIATKIGRKLKPHAAEGYTRQNLTQFVEDSLRNLETDALDLVQLHCPPGKVYENASVFAALDHLQSEGKIKNYGVSVEKVSEALRAIKYPSVKTVQIIFNMFRLKPAIDFFPAAQEKKIGIIARVPLASGLLTGKFTAASEFDPQDHRAYNRKGEFFDKGETFSGVDYATALQAVEDLKTIVPEGMTLSQFALRWILMFDAVSCAIPGAKRPDQVEQNTAAASVPRIDAATMQRVEEIYNRSIREEVHMQW